MKQYILKSALVAEIERRKNYYENIQMIKPVYESNIEDFNELLSFLDTIEVKDLDINKEISHFIDANFKKAKIGHKLSLRRVAKHFFELGMSVNNKAQKGE